MVSPSKKPKLIEEQLISINTVLPDACNVNLPLETVYISQINNKKDISAIMQQLTKLLPLTSLQHLKRVNQNSIIICKEEDVSNTTLESYLKSATIAPEIIEILTANIKKIKVAGCATKLRAQYVVMHQLWPCKFYPDKYLESLYDGSNFKPTEKSFHIKITKLLLQLSQDLEDNKPFGLCIDPRTNSIVALAASKTKLSPLMHCPMVLIDLVAKTQNSGAWRTQLEQNFMEHADTDEVTLAGITQRYYTFIKENNYFANINLGAERIMPNSSTQKLENLNLLHIDNLTKFGPYLCTGYDVYLTCEPCLMCAMALVHSRVKRIFFVQTSSNGALCTRLKLHSVKDLNHHYEVFQCTLVNNAQNSIN